MLDLITYLKAKSTMCKTLLDCYKCPLGYDVDRNLNCMEFEGLYTEEAIEIVEKWMKNNPIEKTLKDVVLEVFPTVKIKPESSIPATCPSKLFKNVPDLCDSKNKGNCINCWNRSASIIPGQKIKRELI